MGIGTETLSEVVPDMHVELSPWYANTTCLICHVRLLNRPYQIPVVRKDFANNPSQSLEIALEGAG